MKNFAIIRTCFVAAIIFTWLAAPVYAAGTWTSVRSKNFLLIGDADEKDIRDTAVRLEQFREAFRQLFPAIRLGDGAQTNVLVFRNSESFRPFKPKRTDGSADDVVAGFFVPGEGVNYIALSIASSKTEPQSTAFHEYVHFLLRTNFRGADLPPWLNEGIAEYYQTARIDSGQTVYLGGAPNQHLALLRKSALISLKTLVEMDDEALKNSSDQQRALFYAEAWAAVHFLMNGGRMAAPAERLGQIFSLIQSKETAEKVFQTDYAPAEKALRAYIDQPSLPETTVSLPAKLSADISISSSLLTESEATAYLGDLSHHTGDLASAETLLRKSLALDADSVLANSSLGTLLARQNNFAEARKYLEKAASSDRAGYLTHFNYAFALSQQEMDERGRVSEFSPDTEKRMRASLRRAIELNPDFAESYRLLALVDLVNDGDLEEASTLLRKGLTIRPGDPDFESLLAQILLRREKYAEAKQIAERIRKNAADPKLRSEADEVLRTVDEFFAVRSVGAEERTGEFRNMPKLLFLKRSAVSDADIARFEDDRRINNLNYILERPRTGEKQIVGYIERVSCTDDGIDYRVRAASGRLNFTSADFGGLRLSVLTEGKNAYQIDCGSSFEKQLTVLSYRPTSGAKARTAGQITAIAFVPDYFRLKTPEEMAKARIVVIEDDTLRGSRLRKAAQGTGGEKAQPK